MTSLDECPSNLTEWRDDQSFLPEIYEASRTVNWFHQHGFRFGASKDVLSFITDEGSNSNYVTGLFASAILTGILLLIWGIFIMYFSCIRHHRPNSKKDELVLEYQKEEKENVLLGKPFVKALPPRTPFRPRTTLGTNPTMDDRDAKILAENNNELRERTIRQYNRDYRRYQKDYYEWKYDNTTYKRRILFTRMTVILGCLFIITASTLFYLRGVDDLSTQREQSRDQLERIQDKAQQGIDYIDEFLQNVEDSNSAVILDQVNRFCPLIRPTICKDMETQTGCNWSGIPYGASLRSWIHTLHHVHTDLADQMRKFHSDLSLSIHQVDEWIDSMDRLQTTLNWSSACVVFLDILCLYILTGVLMAWCKIRSASSIFLWIRSFCLIPVFIFAVFLTWMFSMVFVIGSLTTSDFCFHGPDQVIIDLVGRNPSLSPTFSSLIQHFATKCSNSFVPDIFTDEIDQLIKSVNDSGMLRTTMRQFQYYERDLCGPFSLDTLTQASTMAQTELCSATASLQDTRALFGCSEWSPLYTSLAYDSLCNDTIDGLAWITISQCVIVFVAMVILTFRVVILPVKYVRWTPKTKVLSKEVSTDLKRLSDLAAASSKERLKGMELEPLYVVAYSDAGDSVTEQSMSDNIEVSTLTEPSMAEHTISDSIKVSALTEPSYNSASEHAHSRILSLQMSDSDDHSSVMSEPDEPPHSMMTILASNRYTEEPEVNQVAKPPGMSILGKRSSIGTVVASNMTRVAPQQYDIDDSNSETDSLAKDINKEDAVFHPYENITGGRDPTSWEDSSYEEHTYLSDGEFDEEPLPSMSESSSGQDKRYFKSPAESLLGSLQHPNQSKSKRNSSSHSRVSASFRSRLADVAEESHSGSHNKMTKSPMPATAANQSKQSSNNWFSLRVDIEQFNMHADSASSLGESFEDLTLKSDSKSLQSFEDTNAPPLQESASDMEGSVVADITESLDQKLGSEGLQEIGNSSTAVLEDSFEELTLKSDTMSLVEDEVLLASGAQEVAAVPKEGDTSELPKDTWHSNLSSSNDEGLAKPGQEDTSSCHFSLNLDLATFHSTDFGGFSDGSGGGSAASFGEEPKKEIIFPMSLLTSPRHGSESSLSSPSLGNLKNVGICSKGSPQPSLGKPVVHEEVSKPSLLAREDATASTPDGVESIEPMSLHSEYVLTRRISAFEIASAASTSSIEAEGTPIQTKSQSTKSLTWENEKGGRETPIDVSVAGSTHDRAKIDISLLQKRADSMRSLNASNSVNIGTASLTDSPGSMFGGKDFDIGLLMKKADSKRSLVSADSSVAISAASSTEMQYYLDDFMGMGSNDLGSALLPSRALDSEMLAVVDESWAQGNDEGGTTPLQSKMKQLAAMAWRHRPTNQSSRIRQLPSDRRMMHPLSRGSELSLADPFGKSFELRPASSRSFHYYLNDSMAPQDGIQTMAALPEAITSELLEDLEETSSLNEDPPVVSELHTTDPRKPLTNDSTLTDTKLRDSQDVDDPKR